ncbi:MAG: hypothetical protein FJY42_04420 [Betaproteobacteria bacterium]|nr:hypothetical protein [Betaproteobacteria bacterium]
MQPTRPPPMSPEELRAHIELTLGAHPVGAERLLRQLQRLEPSARRAVGEAQAAADEDFAATLRKLCCLP